MFDKIFSLGLRREQPKVRRLKETTKLCLETLENRIVPALFYVDALGDKGVGLTE